MARQAQSVLTKPVGTPRVETKAALASGQKALDAAAKAIGDQVASEFLEAVREQGQTLRRHLQAIFQLSPVGRAGFRAHIAKLLNEQRAFVKDAGDTPKGKHLAQCLRSGTVRVSEAVTFSKACDGGFIPNMVQSYHAIITDAREWQRAHAAGNTQGRAKKTPLDRIKDALVRMLRDGEMDATDLPDVAMMVQTMAQLRTKKGETLADAIIRTDKETAAAAAKAEADKVAAKKPTAKKGRKPQQSTHKVTLPKGVTEDRREDDTPAPPLGIERRHEAPPALM